MTTTEASNAHAIRERRNDFDAVASIYDLLAGFVFGGAIRRAQLSLIPDLAFARSALVIGGGTGWLLLELLKRTEIPHVLYVEMSPRMLAYSRSLIEREAPEALHRVEFRQGTHDSLTADDGPFDAIVTNFFLDLFNDENCLEIARKLEARFAPHGRWSFVDFHHPPGVLRRVLSWTLFKVMFTFFNVVANMESRTPPDYGRVLHALDLETESKRDFYASIIQARVLRRRRAT